jgi:microcystin-dependent protein
MFEGGDPSFPIWSGTFGLYKGTGSQVEITDLPNASYPETISDNVSEGKFDVISSVVDMANNIESLVLEADFPGGGLEGQILAKLSDDDFDTVWLDNYAQELRIIVKNDSGVTINKGQAVMAVGSVGDRIRVAKANADGSVSARFMLGVASENITNGNEGYINLLGAITKVNTSAYTVGTVLYIDPATPGALTSTEPTSPQLDMSVAIVTRQHPTTGIIFVRMWNQGVDLGEVNDVKITTPADNQVLTYDSSTSIWVNEPIPQAVPAGVISQFAGASAPSGYLLCDGSAVSRTTYSALFAALDTTYGAGNGTTTFNLPNLQNRVPVGKGSGTFGSLNASGGSEDVTLTVDQIPSHNHTQNSHNHTQDAHNHTQNSHNHTQDAHNHTQNAHNHGASSGDAGSHAHTASTTTNGAHTHGSSGSHSHSSYLGTFVSRATSTVAANSQSTTTSVINTATTTSTSHEHTSAGGHTHTITVDAGGSHSHTVSVNNATPTNNATTATNQATTATNQATTATNQATTATNNPTGGGLAHSNLQPFIVLNYIIKT